MSTERLRTTDYTPEARRRLGTAVQRARLALGYRSRDAFATVARVGKRSVDALETGEPTVGSRTLTLVGHALGQHIAGWSEDTPRHILEGQPVPPIELHARAREFDGAVEPRPLRFADTKELLRVSLELLHKQGMSPRAIKATVDRMLDDIR